ncbi:hypothetical protein [Nocardia arizonensis]|uniref:hypothetical protein n=1 Tax=Nocardia arizonensis TaxID=1141647 RepID=UPI0006D0E6CD|nr:hypothetical protein [Nocardia arizonensis]
MIDLFAIDDEELAYSWEDREQKYRANNYYGAQSPSAIDVLNGSRDIIVTAPHALHHFRDGRKKPADRWTGACAELLHLGLDATAIIPTGPIPDWTTWDERDDPFRQALDRLCTPETLVIDLHGMSNAHGVDVCVGLGPEPAADTGEFAEWLVDSLRPYEVSLNEPFSAAPHYTVTSHVQTRTPADAIQVEMALRVRDPADHPQRSADFLRRLASSIRKFADCRTPPTAAG